MTRAVKTIIEDCIGEIDAEDWETLFDRWIEVSDAPTLVEDSELFDEFCSIMEEIGIKNFKERTLNIRTRFIKKYLTEIIEILISECPSNNNLPCEISWEEIMINLDTWLGFTPYDLIEILSQWPDTSLIPDSEHQIFTLK